MTAIDRKQGHKAGRIRNIRFENIDCCGENGVFLHGSADNYLEDISLRGMRIHMKKQTRWPLHQWDLRPCEAPGLVPGAPHGVTCVYGKGIRCEDVRVTHDENMNEWLDGQDFFWQNTEDILVRE